MKELVWLGDAREQVRTFPLGVRDEVGYALYLAQSGGKHRNAKPLHGLGSGVMEIRSVETSGAYRVVYVASWRDRVFVVHAFQKKSTVGIATPRRELELVRRRLQALRGED